MSKPLSDHKKLDNSFDIPTKGSFAKGGSFRALPKDISSVLVENKEDSKPERIENEHKMLPTTEADEEVSQTEDLVSLELDPIFDRLCPKEEYKKDPVCKVCKKKFNPLKLRKKKYCKFCGNSVCENHARRKRADPQNAESFVRICVECDDKHIKRMILKDFEAELNEKERILAYWEQELKIQQSQINQHQAEFDQALLQKGRNERNYSEQMTFLTDDIARIKEETKKCEKENTVLTKDLNETQKKLADWDNSIQDSQREYQRLLVELSMLDNQIEAVNQDIKLVNKHVKRNNAQNLLSKPNTEGVQPLILFPEKYQKESVAQNEPRSFDTSMNHYGSQSIKLINPPKKKRQDETIPACSCTRCNIF